MSKAVIGDKELQTWAGWLVKHSLGGVGAGDVGMVKGEPVAWPLINALQQQVIQQGAVPDLWLVPPDNDRGKVWGAAMARFGSKEQVERVPPWLMDRYQAMTHYIEVLGAEDPSLYTDLPRELDQAIMAADEPYKTLRLAKRWALTLYPTDGFAAMEGMSLDEYTRVVVDASLADPRPLVAYEEEIYDVMQGASQMRVVTRCPHKDRDLVLTVSIEDRLVQQSYGIHNWPDGEVFTSPDANATDGELYLDLPVIYGGTAISGIYLKFEHGRIVDYSAEKGADQVRSIIETDEGSHRLGEVALGMNPGLSRVLSHPLFVEKVGGTLHVAIGASYPQCYVEDPGSDEGQAKLAELEKQGILNKSAQHVDIVADFREGGCGKAVEIDGKVLTIKDGVWAPR